MLKPAQPTSHLTLASCWTKRCVTSTCSMRSPSRTEAIDGQSNSPTKEMPGKQRNDCTIPSSRDGSCTCIWAILVLGNTSAASQPTVRPLHQILRGQPSLMDLLRASLYLLANGMRRCSWARGSLQNHTQLFVFGHSAKILDGLIIVQLV